MQLHKDSVTCIIATDFIQQRIYLKLFVKQLTQTKEASSV